MKVNIRSSVAYDLNNILSTSECTSFCLRLGQLTRDGFIPKMSHWQQKNIREGLEKIGILQNKIQGSIIFDPVYNIGEVGKYELLLGKISKNNVPTFSYESYEIPGPICCLHIVNSYIQIEFPKGVNDLKTLFEPIKFIYGFIKESLTPIKGQTYLDQKYSSLSHLLIQKAPTNNFILAPFLSSGDWGTLRICEDSAHLLIERQVYVINNEVSGHPNVSIFEGYWEDDIFIIYIPIKINGKDMSMYNISHRLALAKRATLNLSFCKVTKIFTTSKETQESMCCRYGGVIYIQRNIKNCVFEVYRPVHRINMLFSVSQKSYSGFSFFELCDGSGVFRGSKEYPYNSPISLSKEDRDLLAHFSPCSVLEFRWENDNLVLYSKSHKLFPTSNEYEWKLLHDIEDLFKNTNLNLKTIMMAHQKKPLKMLPVNKSVVFYSPIEGEDVLVRTGTIGEGSCLFHALLHAYSKDYATMDRKGRMKFVIRLRASMAGKVDIESWEEMGGGLISKVPYQENVCEILENFYHFVQEGGKVRGRSTRRVIKKLKKDDKKLSEVYNILTELISFNVLTSKCLPQGYERTQDKNIEDTNIAVCEEVINHLRSLEEIKQLGDKKASYIEVKIIELLTTVLEESKNSAYRSYIKGLERVSEDVDSYTIEYISNRFNRDVYFLDGTSRLPYNTCPTTNNLKGRKSMIVLWVGGNHYEIVGRLLPGNKIQREFPADDELINRVRTFLTQPEKIKEIYPDLIEHLPKFYHSESPRRRDTLSRRSNRSSNGVEDSESDYYYDSSDHNSEADSDYYSDSS
jgi:hypothetical protein